MAEKNHTPKNTRRKQEARLGAVQALYQLDLAANDVPVDKTIQYLLEQFAEHRAERLLSGKPEDRLDMDPDEALLTKLVEGTNAARETLDEKIVPCLSKDWTFARLGPVLRSLLRAAVFELTSDTTPPAKVVIHEYVSIAEALLDDHDRPFVNAILDRLARELRPQDFPPQA